jgi:hypothetical protein
MAALNDTIPLPEDQHSINVRALFIWLAVITLFYVLSSGPVRKMVDKGAIARTSIVLGFYEPIDWIYWQTPFHKALGMYLHLWSNRFDKNGEMKLN